jgi:hypothetical protein
MSVREPRYSKEEFAQRGEAIYQKQIRPQLEPGHEGEILAIDIETGAYEIARDTLAASDQLLARIPDAQIWFIRIGSRSVHRFGPRAVSEKS